MSDTPRTDAVYFRSGSTKYDLAGEMKELERENAALRDAIEESEEFARKNGETCGSKIRELLADNAALRVDKERLDWLAVTDVWFDEPATECYTPETFRAEIDRKRKNNP